jgi:dUTP pyrophosphatase
MPEIPLMLLDEGLAIVPSYAKLGDAAVDLMSRIDATIPARGGRAIVPTGIAIALPVGYAGYVLSRSGLAANHGVACLNAPGLVDSGYRGEIQVILVNTDPHVSYEVHRGDRVAQLMVVAADQVNFHLVDSLDDTDRGTKGFGHTGR